MVKVKLHGDAVVEGEVFAVDPVTSSLIIRDSDETFTLINHTQIVSIEGDINLRNLPNVNECGPYLNSLEKFEAKAFETAERSIAALNFNVNAEIQTLFDRLNFIFPCVWNGTSILVLNEFIIDSPYDAVRSIRQAGPSNAEGLDRVIKVLEGERKKLRL